MLNIWKLEKDILEKNESAQRKKIKLYLKYVSLKIAKCFGLGDYLSKKLVTCEKR